MDIFLAQLLGVYFIIVGAVVLMRGKSLLPAVSGLGSDRPLLLIVGVLELAAGLALVLAYPTVSLSVPGLISLIGYVMAIEGVVYLGASQAFTQRLIRRFNKKEWYVVGGLAAIGLGAYLANFGFSLGFF